MSALPTVGERIGPLVKAPVTRLQLVKYAGACGDFNPIHTDEEFARAAGYPGVFAHGMLSMAFVGQLVSDWAGPSTVERVQVRFKAITWPGDVVTCHGEVTAALPLEGGGARVEIKVWAETAKGITVEGTATVKWKAGR